MLSADTGQPTTDSIAGFRPAIDKALRALGTPEADLSEATVADGSVPAFLALCEYHALVRIWHALATRADPAGVRNVNSARAQVVQHVKDQVADLAATCASLGYPVGGAGGAGASKPDVTPSAWSGLIGFHGTDKSGVEIGHMFGKRQWGAQPEDFDD